MKDKIEEKIEEIADCFQGENISYHAGKIRAILSYLLSSQMKEVLEVIESKRQTPTKEPESVQVKNCDELNVWLEHTGRNNYNFALDDIKAELEKEDR